MKRLSYKISYTILSIVIVLSCGCGPKKAETKTPEDQKKEEKVEQSAEKSAQTQQAKNSVAAWLGDEASRQVQGHVETIAKDIGLKVTKDPAVTASLKKLTKALFKSKNVKQHTDQIADKATSGFRKKAKLAWQALTNGGVDAYKKKVKSNTSRIGEEVITQHLKENVAKDPRTAKITKKFLPIIAVQSKLAAISLQQNLSPIVSQKILSIALKLAIPGNTAQTAEKVKSWTAGCKGHVESSIKKLLTDSAKLPAVHQAATNLIVEILNHETTKREITQMMTNILADKAANAAMVKAYEKSAFNEGDAAIRSAIQAIVVIPVVNDELFLAMERLATAKGASAIVEKHIGPVGNDPALAELVDNFVIDVINTCGDPIK